MDPKQVVADGYDQIAEAYAAAALKASQRDGGSVRDRYLTQITAGLADGASVLDLGCATGVPVAQKLAERFEVTGVDISARSIELARQNVPNATFIHGDMTSLTFPEASFDAVVSFFAIFHVPREQHAPLFRAIASWLQPGGVLVTTLLSRANPGLVETWLEARMFYSGFSGDAGTDVVRASGLEIVSARLETAEEDGKPVTFFWIIARKPSEPPVGP